MKLIVKSIVLVFVISLALPSCKTTEKADTTAGPTTGQTVMDHALSPEIRAQIEELAQAYVRLEKSRSHMEKMISAGRREKSELEKIDQQVIKLDSEINQLLTTPKRWEIFNKAKEDFQKTIR